MPSGSAPPWREPGGDALVGGARGAPGGRRPPRQRRGGPTPVACLRRADRPAARGGSGPAQRRAYPKRSRRSTRSSPRRRVRKAGPRVDAAATAVRRAGLDGARLDLPDASQDSALTTFTMCTIPTWTRRSARSGGCSGPEAAAALPRARSRADGVVRWQHRLQPLRGGDVRGLPGLHPPIATLVRRPVRDRGLATSTPSLRPMSYVYRLGHGPLTASPGRRRRGPSPRAGLRSWLPVPSAAIQHPAAPSTAPPSASSEVVPAEVDRREHGERQEHPHRDPDPALHPEQLGHQADGDHDPDVQRRERRDGLHGMGGERVVEHRVAVLDHRLLERGDVGVRQRREVLRLGVDRAQRRHHEVRRDAQHPVDGDGGDVPRPARPVARPDQRDDQRHRHEHDPGDVDEGEEAAPPSRCRTRRAAPWPGRGRATGSGRGGPACRPTGAG